MKKTKFTLLTLFFLIAFSINSWAQKTQVSGKVVDEQNMPLPGANVVESGTKNGVMTDFDGKFKLDVSKSNAVIVVSFMGYADQSIKLSGSKTNLTVKLVSGANNLEQVVVVGYGKSSRKNLTSAVTSVKAEALNRGAISDVGQLLQGKSSGLNISASGDPNRKASVVLRGASTLNSSQGPFYVVDGVPGVDISLVSPDDIATIDVLKDAAATAIYGNRAANGVIMVTTKKGSKEKAQISYSSYVGFEKVSNQLDMMNATQLRAFVTKNNLAFTPENDKGANTNWQKEILRSGALSTSHNLSISGGGEHGNYMASLTTLNREGVILTSDFSRVIAHLAIEQYAFNDNVKFGLNVSNSNTNAQNVAQRNTVLLQAVNHLPVSPVKNADGTYFENFISTGYFNPVALINHGDDDTKTSNLVGNFTTEIKLPFGLKYNLNLAYQKSTTLHGEFYDSYYQKYNSANFYNNPDPPAVHSLINFGVNGSALRNTYTNTNNIIESFLTWDKTFGNHKINAVLGYSWQEDVLGDGFQATTTNFPVDNVSYNNLALSNYSSVSGYRVDFGSSTAYQKTRLISDFFRLNYNYNDKYLIQGSIRRDGGSVFGANNRWGYFPSIGGAWRVDKEGFMADQKVFEDLKLRASYGVTGNSSGFNAYTAQFISGSLGTFYYNGQQIGAYGPNQAANPDLQWEKTSTANIGLDFTVLKGKLSGSVDYYEKKTTGMITSYSVNPILVPIGSIVANGGTMSNKGIEVSLNATPVQTKNFTWSTGMNASHNKNEITKLTNPFFIGGDSIRRVQPEGGGQTGSTLQILKEGKPLGQFFTLQYAGKNANGVSQYYDKNGNLTTTPAIGTDYHYAGSAQPKLLLGWSNDFKYKNFDLNIFIRGVFGNKIFNATRADLFRPATAMTTNILVDAANESPSDLNSFKYSTRFIEDGSYIRLDNATLGYNFPQIHKYIKSLRIYSTVNNLFVITKYSGIDPEVEQGGTAPGVDSNNFYPKTRTVLFGLKASF
ncbi:iron complex outermembrane recepter protein [Flavobacterium glycines]|uniref:Iron complex outermembrane recepter protein n=1 Tax=Flavobacterium glycines TaxID=551990 RepID=A0A1B9DRB8_9FLAO|nr:TonB-dependent receptor [Flavobacterium glycines]OCB72246.1 SusC/RagA family TonB-linked outer membrane protein [Flavobacterium glycines]GEL09709.1 SusC/RagA family TonB-linked outer membrane protein [Flavobacterium glycines]SDI96678.1 iron complex outermembrane recepter protein [Flavobacterium glycines]